MSCITIIKCAKIHSCGKWLRIVSLKRPLSRWQIPSPPGWDVGSDIVRNEITDLKSPLHPILCHLRLGLLGCCRFLGQVAQHKKRLIRHNANKLARGWPKDLRAQRGKKREIFYTRNVTVDWEDVVGVTDVFGLNVDAANQFRLLPVVKCQSTPGLHPE